MKKLVILLTFGLSLASCDKSEPQPEKPQCEIDGTGKIIVSNSTNDTYTFYVGNKLVATLEGGDAKTDIYFKAGTYEFYSLQKDGYLLYPTEIKEHVTIKVCEDAIYHIR